MDQCWISGGWTLFRSLSGYGGRRQSKLRRVLVHTHTSAESACAIHNSQIAIFASPCSCHRICFMNLPVQSTFLGSIVDSVRHKIWEACSKHRALRCPETLKVFLCFIRTWSPWRNQPQDMSSSHFHRALFAYLTFLQRGVLHIMTMACASRLRVGVALPASTAPINQIRPKARDGGSK